MNVRKSGSAKTPLLRSLQRSFFIASRSRQNKIPANEFIELDKQLVSRRKFIEVAGKTALIGTIAGTSFIEACTSESKPVVAIAGAGIAGLSAAYYLKKAGIIAHLYEASPRTGGRMFTAPGLLGNGITTELGGEFIDSTHEDLFKFIKEFNLPVIDTQSESEKALHHACYYFDGKIYSDQEILQLFAPFAEQMQKDIDSLSEVVSYKNYSPDDARLDQMSIAEYFKSLGMDGTLYKLLDVAYTTEYGLDISEQSAINFLVLMNPDMHEEFNYSGYSDERYKVRGGNQLIPDSIAAQLNGQIHIGHSLESIGEKKSGKKILLNFIQNGGKATTMEADYAVITVPFTILRDIPITYPMSERKKEAIKTLGYGKNAKLFIGFNKRIWRDNEFTGLAFSDNGFQCGWDNSQLQEADGGGYTVFTGGTGSDLLAMGTDMDQVKLHLPRIEAFFRGATASFNNRTSRFLWPTYAYVKASYTCFKPGQYTRLSDAQSEPEGNILFAGEHCSYEFQGFMNGGAQTGRRAAEAIVAKTMKIK